MTWVRVWRSAQPRDQMKDGIDCQGATEESVSGTCLVVGTGVCLEV